MGNQRCEGEGQGSLRGSELNTWDKVEELLQPPPACLNDVNYKFKNFPLETQKQ
jgi:hypothetical protein